MVPAAPAARGGRERAHGGAVGGPALRQQARLSGEGRTSRSARSMRRELDAIVIPGGFAPKNFRRTAGDRIWCARCTTRAALVAAICHAGWMLASAGLPRGEGDLRADHQGRRHQRRRQLVDEPVVRDGNIITSRLPGDLPVFCKEILATSRRRRRGATRRRCCAAVAGRAPTTADYVKPAASCRPRPARRPPTTGCTRWRGNEIGRAQARPHPAARDGRRFARPRPAIPNAADQDDRAVPGGRRRGRRRARHRRAVHGEPRAVGGGRELRRRRRHDRHGEGRAVRGRRLHHLRRYAEHARHQRRGLSEAAYDRSRTSFRSG